MMGASSHVLLVKNQRRTFHVRRSIIWRFEVRRWALRFDWPDFRLNTAKSSSVCITWTLKKYVQELLFEGCEPLFRWTGPAAVATLVSSWSEGFQARLCQEHNSAYIDKPHTESVDLMLYRIGGNKQAAGEFPCSNSGYIFSAHETEYFWG
nr:uncharacterized protein LOC112287083 isoform X2 [Physcomitrium patens]|eukprot:XP_024385497.1 uncharacterized protein LOC112287083 isoform X2 [Physcomitrella patens]